MSNVNATVAQSAEICARLLRQETRAGIRRALGVSDRSIGAAVKILRSFGHSVLIRQPNPDTDEKKRSALLLIETTDLSNRAIVRRTGLRLDSVGKLRRKADLDHEAAGGVRKRCACGQDLHHPRICWVRHHQSMRDRGVRSVHALPEATRAQVRLKLLAGETLRAVAEFCQMPKNSVQRYLQTFSDEDRRARTDKFRVKASRRRAALFNNKIQRQQSTDPRADPLYERISSMVPRSIDRALRDDMISEAYLQVLEGRMKGAPERADIKRVMNEIFKKFADKWGSVSLDEPLSPGSSVLLRDTIAEDAGLYA